MYLLFGGNTKQLMHSKQLSVMGLEYILVYWFKKCASTGTENIISLIFGVSKQIKAFIE